MWQLVYALKITKVVKILHRLDILPLSDQQNLL